MSASISRAGFLFLGSVWLVIWRQALTLVLYERSTRPFNYGTNTSLLSRIEALSLLCASSDGRNRLSANLGYFDPRWTSARLPDVPAANTNGEIHDFVFPRHRSTASKKNCGAASLGGHTGEKTWFTQSGRFETVWEPTARAKELSGIGGRNQRSQLPARPGVQTRLWKLNR